MSKGEIIKGYSGVAFYEYTSWCHRYKVLGDNGKVKYLKLKGYQTEDEAVQEQKEDEAVQDQTKNQAL